MKFTPELKFSAGKLRPLVMADIDILWDLYQSPELPGQAKPSDKSQLERIIDYSLKMAATQRGMMWLIEVNGEVQGMLNAFDWQATELRVMLRVDALPALAIADRQAAVQCCMDFMAQKYHIRNFSYQWIAGQSPSIQTMLSNLGFELRATLRQAWRVAEGKFVDIEQYHFLNHQEKPKAGRLGEFDNPAQNLDKDVNAQEQ